MSRKLLLEFFYFFPCFRGKVALHPTDTTDVGGESCSADLLEYFVNQLAPLEHVQKPGHGTGIHRDHRIAYDVIGNARQLHDDHAQVLGPLGDLCTDELLYRRSEERRVGKECRSRW